MCMKSEKNEKSVYEAPASTIVELQSMQNPLAGSIGSHDSGFIQVGDVVSGDEENAWE